MSELAKISVILGGCLTLVYVPMVLAPAKALSCCKAFPRHAWAGRVLTAIVAVWIAWVLKQTPLGGLESYRRTFYALVPIMSILIMVFMTDLLAARSLGGLLMLVPVPMLEAAFVHESRWRYVIVVLAYVMVIKGMTLVLNPYWFRKGCDRLIKSNKACRSWGLAGLVIAIGLLALGLFVY